MKTHILVALACFLLPSGRFVEAQETPLSQLVVNLFQPERFLNAVGVGPNHTAHFQLSGGTGGNEILFLNAALVNQAIISQLTSLPLGSSSGGFTYAFNPDVGTFESHERELRAIARGESADQRPGQIQLRRQLSELFLRLLRRQGPRFRRAEVLPPPQRLLRAPGKRDPDQPRVRGRF